MNSLLVGNLHRNEPIAVIGVSCRLPKANNPGEFWRLIRSGGCAVARAPQRRWGTAIRQARDRGTGDRGVLDSGGFLDQVDRFDPEFFGISPHEAATMDPQQRLMLELAWEALEDAAIVPGSLSGTSAGVFVGAMWNDFATLRHRDGLSVIDGYAATGLSGSIIANRMSYFLGFRGPSLLVDTGQSSSLVSVHLACASLSSGESTVALAGGINLNLAPESATIAAEFGALSPDGRCYTFDSRANGYVRGEGGGLVVLKPLSSAVADGNSIYCLIRGSAVNNDGGGAALTTPAREAQQELLGQAYRKAGVDPGEVQYVELHGTGTRVGDPIEAAALGAALGAAPRRRQPLVVGSAKTNVGHLESAAGITGLIKAVLCIKHREIVPSLNFVEPSPDIPLDSLNLTVQTELGPWADPDRPLVAGVSAFGMGGTNCHVVLSDLPQVGVNQVDGPTAAPPVLPLVLSGRTAQALSAQAQRLLEHMGAHPGLCLADVAFSLATTRSAFDHRAVLIASSREDFLDRLATMDSVGPSVTGSPLPTGRVAFLFSGQGSQRLAMGADLYAVFPVFAAALDAVCDHLDRQLERPLREVLFADQGSADAALLDQTVFTQSGLFAVETALYRLFESWGLRPDFLLGHSLGELTAAHVAGILSLADACTLVAARGRLMQALPAGGAMVVIHAAAEDVESMLTNCAHQVSIAAVNGPFSTVISGAEDAVSVVAAQCAAEQIRVKRLRVSHAFHSPRMEPMIAEFRRVAETVTLHSPDIPVISNLTGEPLSAKEISADYWVRHIRGTVRFMAGMRWLHGAGGVRTFLELGPDSVLTAMGQDCLVEHAADIRLIPALRSDLPEVLAITRAIGHMHVRTDKVDWRGYFDGLPVHPVALPSYAFQRRRHWFSDTASVSAEPRSPHADAPEVAATAEAGPAEHDLRTLLRQSSPAEQREVLLELVLTQAAAILGYAAATEVNSERTFQELGFGSLTIVGLCGRINQASKLYLTAPVLYNYPTPATLAEYLRTELIGEGGAIDDRAARSTADAAEPIAIVAMGCRYPGGVRTPQDLWQLVVDGRDSITAFPSNRGWNLTELFHPDPDHPGTSYADAGGFLHDADQFDPAFFGISPREALAMDPQQRVLLEIAWESFERAGIDPAAVPGGQAGVFVGAAAQDYGPRLHEAGAGVGGYLLTGNTSSVLSGRIAYTFGFSGPAITVDTACSSSLVAVHLAVQSLRRGECSFALAGGATVMATPGMFIEFSRQRGLAPDSRCKPFAAAADGTIWSEGAGLLLLERLSDANRNGHTVLAVLRGTAVNQDGASNGLTAPNGLAQQQVIDQALADAQLAASDIDVVEAHGTGTALGDPIEAAALIATYGRHRVPGHPLLLGSLKSNIGHAQAAAGVGGVIKMVMAMRHNLVPKSLHIDAPSPHVDWSAGDVALLTEASDWPETGRPHRAAVSSFGISGTNAHVILEQARELRTYTQTTESNSSPAIFPLILSARTPAALRARAGQLLSASADHEPRDVAAILAKSSAAMAERAVVVGDDGPQILDGLRSIAAGDVAPNVVVGTVRPPGKLAFLFAGQGSQYVGMGAALYDRYPVYTAAFDQICSYVDQHLEHPLAAVVFADAASPQAGLLEQTAYTQAALFAVEVALFRLVESWGVRPDFVAGHSIGEIAAAHVAGALSLEDACSLVAARGQLMQLMPADGAMVAIRATEDEVRASMAGAAGQVDIAAVNGPESVVISGAADAVIELAEGWAALGRSTRRLPVSHAFHSSQMDGMLAEFRSVTERLVVTPATLPIVSCLTGQALTHEEISAPDYWVRQVRDTVQFGAGVRWLQDHGVTNYLELGPDGALTAMGRDSIADRAGQDVELVAGLRRNHRADTTLVMAVARLHTLGVPADFSSLCGNRPDHLVELPTYPFESRRYWLESAVEPTGTVEALGLRSADHGLLGAMVELADGSIVLTGQLSTTSQGWLTDHVVADRVVVPATVFIELAGHAAAQVPGCAIDELVVTAPLVLPAGDPVRIQVTMHPASPTGDRSLSVHSRREHADAQWIRHASGQLATAGSAPSVAPADWLPAGAQEMSVDDLYAALAAAGLRYGPSFRGVRRAWRHGAEVYTEVALPPELSGPARGYAIHPALLDAALHGAGLAGFFATAEGGSSPRTRLPFSWSGIRLYTRGSSELRVRIVPTGRDSIALQLADLVGRPVAEIAELTVRPFTPPSADRGFPHDSLLQLAWQPTPGNEKAAQHNWAVIGNDPLGLAGENRLTAFADLAATVASGRPAPEVVFAVLTAAGGTPVGRAVRESVDRALTLLQSWLADDRFHSSRLVLVTNAAIATGAVLAGDPAQRDDDVVDLAHASVWGLVRSAQREHPDRFVLIDVDDHDESLRAIPGAVRLAEPQLAIRTGTVYVPRLITSDQPAGAAATNPFGTGTVLVTGATGALGRLMTRRLVTEHGVEDLLLVSRRGRGAPLADELHAELTALGARSTWAACDVADRESVETLLASIPATRPLTAILHTAGVLDDRVIGSLTPDRVDTVLRPKVDAAWHLHELTRALDLEAFVLCSSASGVFGAAGQANYAAANCFLDALAQHRRANGLAATSMAWAPWADGGMAATLSSTDRARLAAIGMTALSTADGLALFDAALAPTAPPLVVPLRLDTAALVGPPGELPPPLLRNLLRDNVGVAEGASSETTFQQVLANSPARDHKRMVLSLIRTEVAIVLAQDSADSFDAATGFREIGLDSLAALELRNRLNRATGLQLSPTVAFDYPSPAGLADHLQAALVPPNDDALSTPEDDPDQIDELAIDDLVAFARQSLSS
ncbi:type I polyketide synthase [Nocardia sp. CA-128927]|uniref:type I polyketide synthase n=1 Tax=Nocardia sp. CA-128927 TaxID=3239975 RepID=UPI003D98E446